MFWFHNSISDSLQISRIKKEKLAAHKHSRTIQVHRLRCTETSQRVFLRLWQVQNFGTNACGNLTFPLAPCLELNLSFDEANRLGEEIS